MHWCSIVVIVGSVASIIAAQDDCMPGPRGVPTSDSCQAPGSPRICSGSGTCKCGECVCYERPNPAELIMGRFCECTNFLCARTNGKLCGGPGIGFCECNECVCRPGFYGDACEYSSSQENCINPDNGEICSGNGRCENNQCVCHETEEGLYSGKWCADCPTCKGECTTFKPCVQCLVFGTGELSSRNCRSFCRMLKKHTSVVPLLEVSEDERLCSFFDEIDCRFTFAYGYNENEKPVIRVQQAMDCPPNPSIIGPRHTEFTEDSENIQEEFTEDSENIQEEFPPPQLGKTNDGKAQLTEATNLLGAFYGFTKDVFDNTFIRFLKETSTHLRRW